VKIVVLAAAGVAATLVLAVVVLAGGVSGPSVSSAVASVAQAASEACLVTGPVPGLGAGEAANADAVVSAAMAASGEDASASQVALDAALAMSGLKDLVGRGNGALGLYQELPSPTWGTSAQLTDPPSATVAFVGHLNVVHRWRSLAPWQAAEEAELPVLAPIAVLQADWGRAGEIEAAVVRNADAPGGCGQGSGPQVAPGASKGLPPGYAVPAGVPSAHTQAVSFALAQLGKPYVWGAAGPAAYDCSGLTMAAWASAGVALAHYTGDQQDEGAPVSLAVLVPGDLVLVPGSSPPGPGIAGHVGIYLGDGLVESAVDPALGVAVQTWDSFVSGGLVALRDPDPGQ
jgi:cell wall-associated NlpC family hydrolase